MEEGNMKHEKEEQQKMKVDTPSQPSTVTEARPVDQWSIEEVYEWTKTIVKEHVKVLKEQEVDGQALLTLTEEKLGSVGIPLGPAANLAQAIDKLKIPTGWVRDLTKEGIEPNLGPIGWGDIEMAFKDKLGSDFSDKHGIALDDLRKKIRTYCNLDPIDLLEDKWVTKYFSDTANQKHLFRATIEEIILDLTKSKALPPSVPQQGLVQPVQKLVDFQWKGEGQSVWLKGSWNWNNEYRMKLKYSDFFSVQVFIPVGNHEYGFLVDNKWEIDRGEHNNGKNNIIQVTEEMSSVEELLEKLRKQEMEIHRLALLGIRSLTHIGVVSTIQSQHNGFDLNPTVVLETLPPINEATVASIWKEVRKNLVLPADNSDEPTYQNEIEKLLKKTIDELKKRNSKTPILKFKQKLASPEVEEDIVFFAPRESQYNHRTVMVVGEVESRRDGTRCDISKSKEGIGQAVSYEANSLLERSESKFGLCFFTDFKEINIVKIEIVPAGKDGSLKFYETGNVPLWSASVKPSIGFEYLLHLLIATPAELGYTEQLLDSIIVGGQIVNLEECLGVGKNSCVYKVGDEAVKIASRGSVVDYTGEVGILKIFNGDNKFPQIQQRTTHTALFIKPIGVSLVQQVANGITQNTALKFTKDILEILEIAHRKEIVHRDVRPHNIIIYQDHAMLIDWGYAASTKEEVQFAGTYQFSATKVLKRVKSQYPRQYESIYDLESLAYVLLYMVEGGKLPWRKGSSVMEIESSRIQYFENLTKNSRTPQGDFWKIINECQPNIYTNLKNLLNNSIV